MLPTDIKNLILQFHDEFGQVQKKKDLNRLVQYAYSEWLFSKGKTEAESKHDIWTRSFYHPIEFYIDDSEWLHFLGMFLMYDYNFVRERNYLKKILPSW